MSKTHAAAEASSPRQAKRARGGEAANEAAAAASVVGYAEAANKHLEALAVDHLYHLGAFGASSRVACCVAERPLRGAARICTAQG